TRRDRGSQPRPAESPGGVEAALVGPLPPLGPARHPPWPPATSSAEIQTVKERGDETALVTEMVDRGGCRSPDHWGRCGRRLLARQDVRSGLHAGTGRGG